MTIDSIVYRNLMHLIEKNGLTEHLCTSACRLNSNFFLNYRKGITKHFRLCDLFELAKFFDVSIDYLCRFENTADEFFLPKHKLKPRDEKVLMYNFKKLDPESRIKLADSISKELAETKSRAANVRHKKTDES